jgi:hypothetical protein
MIFAIFRGNKDKDGLGSFTAGRLYVASPEVDDCQVIEIKKLHVTDDNGDSIWIEPNNERFDYPQEVYGVVLKEIGNMSTGDVVVVDGADDGGKFASVRGIGYIRSDNIQLLDMTIVKPRMWVHNKRSLRWERIRRVDECMRILTDQEDDMLDPQNFCFPIIDGDLGTVPFLRCVDAHGITGVNEGGIYRACGLDDSGGLVVEDDEGNERSFHPDHFTFIGKNKTRG